MKRFLFTIVTIVVCLTTSAEDIIVLRSSKRIAANIEEVGKTEVRYKEVNNPNGPTFVLDTDDILSIIYASGSVQNFQQRPKEVSEWEYEEMQEAQRKQAIKDRKDSLAQKQQLMKQRRDSSKTEMLARWKSYPWTNIILANGSFSSAKTFGFGVTYARVKQFGFYVSAMSGTNFRFSEDYIVDRVYGAWIAGDQDFSSRQEIFFSGKQEITNFSLTAGAIFRLKAPLYLYVGTGYGYIGRYYELAGTAKWGRVKGSLHGMSYECGLMGNIKGFGISMGMEFIENFSSPTLILGKLGLGYCF